MDKQYLEGLLKEGLSCRKISTITGKSLTTVLYWVRKHDLKPNHQRFNGGERKYTKELLEKAVIGADSVIAVLRNLGLRPAGGTQALISKRLKEYGLHKDLTIRGKAIGGKRLKKKAEEILILRPPGSVRESHSRLRRALLETGVTPICSWCGTGEEWNGKKLELSIDHINGEWEDNRKENLRFMCPNCHSQTETYCR